MCPKAGPYKMLQVPELLVPAWDTAHGFTLGIMGGCETPRAAEGPSDRGTPGEARRNKDIQRPDCLFNASGGNTGSQKLCPGTKHILSIHNFDTFEQHFITGWI